MSKKLKVVLSFALALVLVLSLGGAAFASEIEKPNGTVIEKTKAIKKEPETIQIAFNLATGEPMALRMRELGYDDIRLDGVSYKADASDGVISINLGDLAAVKLLDENTAKAEELGIDYENLYIRGGKVLVKDDTGLSSGEIASLKQEVNTLMTSVRVGVNIGDIFELANGDEVKLKAQVCNFIYPAPKDNSIRVAVIDEDNAKNLLNIDKETGKPISAKTPEKTTVYFYYEALDICDATEQKTDDDGITTSWTITKEDLYDKTYAEGVMLPSSVGIAKDKYDKNDYYINLAYETKEGETITKTIVTEKAEDLTKTTTNEGFINAMKTLWNNTLGCWAKSVFVSTDKDGKNVVKTIDIKDATPIDTALDGEVPAGYTYYDYEGAEGTTENKEYGVYAPKDTAEVTYNKGGNATVTVRDYIAVEHTWNEGEVTTPATCTEKGVRTYTCTICGETKAEEITATGHEFDEEGKCTHTGCTVEKSDIAVTNGALENSTLLAAAAPAEATPVEATPVDKTNVTEVTTTKKIETKTENSSTGDTERGSGEVVESNVENDGNQAEGE